MLEAWLPAFGEVRGGGEVGLAVGRGGGVTIGGLRFDRQTLKFSVIH